MRLILAALDLLLSTVFVAALVIGVVLSGTFAVGGDLVVVKQILFVIGLFVVGVSVFQLRSGITIDDDTEIRKNRITHRTSRLRSVFEKLLPEPWIVSQSNRFSPSTKRVATGLWILLVSFVMEVCFGIGV